jgi:hypothetical protein
MSDQQSGDDLAFDHAGKDRRGRPRMPSSPARNPQLVPVRQTQLQATDTLREIPRQWHWLPSCGRARRHDRVLRRPKLRCRNPAPESKARLAPAAMQSQLSTVADSIVHFNLRQLCLTLVGASHRLASLGEKGRVTAQNGEFGNHHRQVPRGSRTAPAIHA